MKLYFQSLIFYIAVFLSFRAQAAPPPEDPNVAKLNGGYYLLYQLCEDEDQLPILLDLKHAPPEIGDYAVRVSQTAKRSLNALKEMKDRDDRIRFDENPLPPIERDVRASIKDDKQHQLLFGTSNTEFVHALLISQIEACTYAEHLAQVLSDQEQNPSRAKQLHRLATQWHSVRSDAYRLLN